MDILRFGTSFHWQYRRTIPTSHNAPQKVSGWQTVVSAVWLAPVEKRVEDSKQLFKDFIVGVYEAGAEVNFLCAGVFDFDIQPEPDDIGFLPDSFRSVV